MFMNIAVSFLWNCVEQCRCESMLKNLVLLVRGRDEGDACGNASQ
jgi:hypothetical protein